VILLNLFLAFFNILPIGPLDGAGVVSSLLPTRKARRFDEFSAQWGMLLLMAVIVIRPLRRLLIWTPVDLMMALLIGHSFFL
jgi:Zn-dependent protease